MKKHLLPLSLSLFLGIILFGSLLISCGDDYYWSPQPPNGWNDNYYDGRLTGCWQLAQYNSQAVTGDSRNYLEFNSNGRGWYYYYSRGQLISERIAYWCQKGATSSANNQVNIKYADGTAATMNYWFTNNDTELWLQWHTSSGAVTYMYRYINSIP